MGNATSNQRPSQTASSTGNKPSDVGSRAASTGENSNGSTIHDTGQRSDQTSSVSPFKHGADPSGERGNKKSDGIVTGIFNPHVTIQTLGSGSGPVDDATSGYYYGGMMYNYSENNSTVGATFGAALGGGGYVAGSGDALLSSLQKDLNVNALGGQIVGISRLWPGSGRMMRSYRIRVRVPRMDSKFGVAESASSAAATSRSSPMAAALPFTIELACKSFIVRSEKGEAPLRKSLTEGDAELKRLRSILSDPEIHPHVLFYARWIVGPSSLISPSVTSGPVARPVYLLRQHAHASLSDRLASRPFLTLIEKNWITYQLLNALQSLHDAGVCHGHLTTENVLLTSWNWVLISDVGCQHYKPVTLPDDDPGLWIHWFEGRGGEAGGGGAYGGLQEGKSAAGHSGNGEKKCCLAPERFYTPGLASDAKIYDGKEQSSGKGANKRPVPTKLTPAMDVFSLGCVLIELFLNGERALDLGDLMEYRRHEDGSDLPQSLKQKLDKIESSKMRAACRLMLSLDPASRLSPDEYLERLSCSSSTSKKKSGGAGKKSKKSDKAKLALSSTHAPIPGCFKSTLLPMMLRLRTEILSPDSRIALVASNYGDLLKATVGVDDPWGVAYFCRIIGPTLRRFENPVEGAILGKAETTSNSAIKLEKSNDPLQSDLSAFSLDELLLETEDLLRRLDSGWIVSDDKADSMALLHTSSRQKPLPLLDNVPKSPFNKLGSQPNPSQSSMIILLQVVFSSVRHVQRTSSKFVALKLMHRIALFSPDEVRLQRIVPFVTSLLQDPEPIVRASSIHVLASVLSTVTSFPPSDAQIFPQYVFKKVAHLITDASLIVRVAFAENIALLAETSLRFLDVGHSVSLYEAVVGRRSRDKSNHDKAVLFSEETANLIAKQSSSDDTPAPPTSDMPENITTTITNSYDSDLAVLHEVVLRWVVHITTDTSDHSAQSKQALLCGLPRLCNFFGGENSFQILPQILAFLNDRKDWQLRAALCQNLPSVCVAVGRAATEQFVIPCIESALNDDAEQVVSEALTCLSTLITLSLLTRTSLLGTEIVGTSSSGYDSSSSRSRRKKEGVIRKCAPLLLHQSQIIRCNAADLVLRSWRALGPTDAEVFVNKLLRPYLRYKPTFDGVKSLSHLSACLKTPSLYKSGTEHGKDHPAHMNRQLLQSHQDYYSHMNNVDSEVEFSLKLAHSLSVPSQRAVELTSCIPKWYESLTHSAAMDPKLSWPIFPLGFVSLQKVYGLNITPRMNTSNQCFINWADEKNLSEKVKLEADFSDENNSSILSRPEAKMVESASKGEWGSAAVMEQLVPENSFVINKIQSLDVPPLSPSIGLALKKVDVRSGFDVDVNMRHYWVPKEDNLIGSTTMATEHVASVVRLAVSEDQSFFASASHDGTSKIFELRQTDSGGELHSCLTYDGHKSGSEFSYHSRVNDVAILESSHSVATAASDGSLHVWKVDMVTSHQTQSSIHTKGSRVSGCSTLRQINPDEGEMMAVSHFNAPSASILAYATQRGHIHSLDLRCAREPFALNLRPELGYLTDMQVGDDKNWIVAGTSRGFLALWDIRFQAMVKLWRHGSDSPVKRLASASDSHTNGRKGSMYEASRPLIFMGCDNNEASLFDVSTGDCLQCYRTLDTSLSCVDQSALPMGCLSVPRLESVAIPRSCGKRQVSVDRALQMSTRSLIRDHSVNALVGSISREGPSYLLTGGSDQMIKYWDLNSASKCFCLSGLGRNQPPPSVERIDVGSVSQLFVCRQPSIPPARLTESSRLPSRNRQGIAKCSNRHQDSILDLKLIEEPMMGVLSSSRDGTIKLWA